MFAIVGAAGKVGYSTAVALRKAGMPVRAILRDAKAERLSEIGCEIAIADLQDPDALARAVAGADAVQIILPAIPQAKDMAEDMRQSMESLVVALRQAGSRRVLAISDYGAHVTHDIGMPSMFHTFEARLGELDGHKLLLRSSEHMEGWARVIPAAVASGMLPVFHDPVDRAFPMISAADLGPIAAELLLRPIERRDVEVVHAEGPRRYSPTDVAATVSQLLGRPVSASPVPRAQWRESFERILSPSGAELLTKLYGAHSEGGLIDIEPNAGDVRHGKTELIDALRPLIPRQ
ncbi:NAD(P)H-binding protein [Rhizobium sp. XQZ8]|uniref:NmrA family NAD(P)-binding protein n=1 Tax=Rhizobium populisoli TaxID=2859785 RepID=UPI001CA5E37C|nr:NAD(P)H-binding protein [Rhizobium populisoli]MBW6420574.1 NAD(P)H-binding protein [Rhizobium populisoli]